ncbi:MAG: PfkB family carbohydrate kinase [Ilumatobacteraceae bacterium]
MGPPGGPRAPRPAGGAAPPGPAPPVPPAPPTTGAGDAFAGGFLAATLAGADAGPAAALGIELAVRTLGVPGARLSPAPE